MLLDSTKSPKIRARPDSTFSRPDCHVQAIFCRLAKVGF